MSDDEMTQLCAEAMGLDWEAEKKRVADRDGKWLNGYESPPYDPLANDEQAMALVKKFGLTIDPQQDDPPFTWRVVVALDGDWDHQIPAEGLDLNRAIVECVAALQQASPSTKATRK